MLNNKFLQRFLALGPFVLLLLIFVGYFVAIFSMFTNIETFEQSNEPPTELIAGFGIVFVLLLVMIILSLLSFAYFIIHAAKNPNLEQNNMRVVWILIIVLVNGIGSIIYWIAEIESKKPRPVIS